MTSAEYLENRVLAMPGLQPEVPTPRLLTKFLEDISPKLRLFPAVAANLEFIDNHDLRVIKLKEAMDCYPNDAGNFVNYIRRSRPIEENDPKPLDKAVTIYGLDNSRNLALCIDLFTNISGTPFPWHPTSGAPGMDPNNTLKYAKRAFEEFETANRFPHRAFAAGLIFDALRIFAETSISDKRSSMVEFIDYTYSQGRQTARVLLALSKEMKMMELGEFAVASALLNVIGKAAICIVDPAYMKFSFSLERAGLTRPVIAFAERKRYGISHSVLGYLLCHSFSCFRPIAQSILYSTDPYISKYKGQNSTYQLASSLSIAANIVRTQMKIPGDVRVDSKYAGIADSSVGKMYVGTIRKQWLGAAIDKHELSEEKIFEIVEKLRKSQ